MFVWVWIVWWIVREVVGVNVYNGINGVYFSEFIIFNFIVVIVSIGVVGII